MIEFVAEVTNTPDHAEIRISGYLSSDSAARLDEAMKQVADANRVVLVFDEQYFINSTGLSALFEHIRKARSFVSSIPLLTLGRCSILLG